jgi:hypothetical protein
MHTTDQPSTEPKILLRPAQRRAGGSGSVPAHAAPPGAVQRYPQDAATLLRRQRELGNRMVQRLVAARKAGQENAPQDLTGHAVADDVEAEIQRARGAGQPLDGGARSQMEPALGANLGNVRVHADQRADTLSQALDARAFTTGRDIFFRQGQYAPGSTDGRELLAHELTHVVQQGAATETGVQAKLTVGAPNDEYEQEADHVARQVMRREQEAVQRQPEEDDAEQATKGAAVPNVMATGATEGDSEQLKS